MIECRRSGHIATMGPSWRNPKHRAQWVMTLNVYAKPLRGKLVNEITTADVLAVLQPIWQTVPETASRVRGRIENMLDAAKVQGFRTGENPAAWRGHLKLILPARQKLTRGHHAAMSIDDVPSFMGRLRAREAVAARCLEFCVLTAARSGEALGAVWREINLMTKVWTVPGYDPETGRDWAGDRTDFPRELIGHALSHSIGDEAEQAYRREDALKRRRPLMGAWAAFCAATKIDNMVPMRKAGDRP